MIITTITKVTFNKEISWFTREDCLIPKKEIAMHKTIIPKAKGLKIISGGRYSGIS
jgi:hypothetical protein